MRIALRKLNQYLQRNGIAFKVFMASLSDCDKDTIRALLSEECLDKAQTEKVVYSIGAECAYDIIDWSEVRGGKPSRKQIFANAN